MVKDEEIELLLTDMLELHGYDFFEYSLASIKRRINRLMVIDKFPSVAELRYLVRTDKEYAARFVEEITVNVTEMFRDPLFYKTLRTKVLPELSRLPFIRIWHAGCATGEEVYSMAIVLEEAGLLDKSLLYATDINGAVLERAKKGIFPMNEMKLYSENYNRSGGMGEFSNYYTAGYNRVKFDDRLTSRMVFSTHNLVSDRSFNRFHLILCRNVLIYFNKELQERVLGLFSESLEPQGYLALGSKETMRFSHIAPLFTAVDEKQRIWRKMSK